MLNKKYKSVYKATTQVLNKMTKNWKLYTPCTISHDANTQILTVSGTKRKYTLRIVEVYKYGGSDAIEMPKVLKMSHISSNHEFNHSPWSNDTQAFTTDGHRLAWTDLSNAPNMPKNFTPKSATAGAILMFKNLDSFIMKTMKEQQFKITFKNNADKKLFKVSLKHNPFNCPNGAIIELKDAVLFVNGIEQTATAQGNDFLITLNPDYVSPVVQKSKTLVICDGCAVGYGAKVNTLIIKMLNA